MKKLILLLSMLLTVSFAALAEANEDLRFSRDFIAYHGLVTVYWEDADSAPPYTLYYQCADETLDPQSVFAEKDLTGTSCTLQFLAPGRTYALWIENSAGKPLKRGSACPSQPTLKTES